MATLETPRCSTCSETFLGSLSPKAYECLHFDLESCNLMCTYTVVTHPCHIPPLAQARPMMLCIYTSLLNTLNFQFSYPFYSTEQPCHAVYTSSCIKVWQELEKRLGVQLHCNGFHVYCRVWLPHLGQRLSAEREHENAIGNHGKRT